MSRKTLGLWICSSVALLIAISPSLHADPAWVGKVLPRGVAELNQTPIEVETTMYAGDKVSTARDSLAVIELRHGGRIYMGPRSAVMIEPGPKAGVVAELRQGTLLARSRPGEGVSVWAANLLVRSSSSEALYQVELVDQGAVVAARRGTVQVEGANRAVSVPAGKSLRFDVASPPAEQAREEKDPRRPKGPYARSALSRGQKAAIIVGIGAAVATAIALPLALDDDEKEVVSPAVP